MFGCTEMTIRRDLNEMAEEGLLKRTHGGAVKIGKNFVTDNVKDLLYSNLHNKIYIARQAYKVISAQDTIFLDDATTCLYLAKEIKKNEKKPVNIITNSVLLALELMQAEHVSIKIIGGDAAGNLSATVGQEAVEQIARCRADKAFIGVNGIDFTEGITGIGYPQMEIKQAMLKVQKRPTCWRTAANSGISIFPISAISIRLRPCSRMGIWRRHFRKMPGPMASGYLRRGEEKQKNDTVRTSRDCYE